MVRKYFEVDSNICVVTLENGNVTAVQVEEGGYSFFYERGTKDPLRTTCQQARYEEPTKEERQRVDTIAVAIFAGKHDAMIAQAPVYVPNGSFTIHHRERFEKARRRARSGT